MTRTKYAVSLLLALAGSLAACPALASGAVAPIDGSLLGAVWGLPFVCMLLSIAIIPLILPTLWHHHFGKISLFWALAFLGPYAWRFGLGAASAEFLHTIIQEYIPFTVLLLALFTISGGVRLTGRLNGSPLVNTLLLCLGTFLASVMGTTGASMLLIRPVLRANEHRRHKVHTVVFFIFLVANIGGALTPLGDPPLFLGFLKGVSFFWTTTHLFTEMLFVSSILLTLYFVLDTYLYRKEGRPQPSPEEAGTEEALGLEGRANLLLLLGVAGAVLMSGVWASGKVFSILQVPVTLENLTRDLLLLGLSGLSLALTSREIRALNNFSWEPMAEVAKLFFGIFVSMIPALAILKAGQNGAFRDVIALVTRDGAPVNHMYFWLSGGLSSFLDNAPTYLVFFNTAGGDAAHLMVQAPKTLAAISCGAVFMGANSYIGNAPNFMVRSIAESQGVKMPSFIGYMAWSVGILIPVFVLTTFIFFLS
jgi:Na+/H+ antiporter NhaD/arsenite permease-like protein